MTEQVGVAEQVAARRRGGKRWVLLGLLVLLGAFIWYRHSGHVTKFKPSPQAVGVATARLGSMPEVLDELGTVTPVATVTVLPQISGYVTAVGYTEGQDVAKGQFLVQIDPRPYQITLMQDQATLARDEASLGQARSDLARYEVLARQDSIQAQQVSDQRFTVAADLAATKVDEANIAAAKLNLIYCHITAPVAGRIGLRLVDVGNYVTSGSSTGLAVITSIAPTTVEFSVAQADLAPILVRLGQGAVLPAAAYASDDVTKLEDGTLGAVDNQMDTSTGMVKLRADFPNTDEQLFPNEFVNVHLRVNTLTNVVLVPNPAVQTGVPGTYVYVVGADNVVHVRKVTVGPSDGDNTVIDSGLKPGARVVTDGVDRLTDGQHVMVVASPGAAVPAAGSTKRGLHKHENGAAAQ
ncbi:MAG: efflux RND transporter periplasmic adaptor subunit [Acidocella sp.]|nr:efflux RND transporter periplasmic adaptor subunit [Acidocella sp.]